MSVEERNIGLQIKRRQNEQNIASQRILKQITKTAITDFSWSRGTMRLSPSSRLDRSMASAGVVCITILIALNCLASGSPRKRRQAHVEFHRHFYPFKEMCAKKLGVPMKDVRRSMAHGLAGGQFCANFVLQCQDPFGKWTAYMEQCGIGMWFSFKIGTCEIPSMADRPECVKAICPPGNPGSVPDPRSCYGFYECEAGFAFFEMCEDTSFYNPRTMTCENSATCDRPAPKIKPNGRLCTHSDLPRVCTPPGYVPSLAYCGCVHQHLER